MKKKTTIYEARDRQGTKWFSGKPYYNSIHDIFMGERLHPDNLTKFRVIRNFRCRMEGRQNTPFPSGTILVSPQGIKLA